jgi:hypothetical protein
VAQGKLEDAARWYSDSLAIAKKLAAADPGNTQWQRDLWVSCWKLAKLAERRKKSDEALAFSKQALEILSGIEQRGLHLSPADLKFLAKLRKKVAAGDAQGAPAEGRK